MSNAIKLQTQGSKLIVQFSRPKRRNPLSIDVLSELESILANISSEISDLIFAGSDGVFASGADLKDIAALEQDQVKAFGLRGQSIMATIGGMEAITTAAIDGPCFGGAFDLSLACDRRIASSRSVFCHPGVGLGIMTGWGGTQRLPRLVGEARALEMFLTAKRINAEDALAFGIIDAISEDPLQTALS